jgi:hypothetical protein
VCWQKAPDFIDKIDSPLRPFRLSGDENALRHAPQLMA